MKEESPDFLQKHFAAAKAEIKQHLECTIQTQQTTRRSLRRALRNLRDSFFSVRKIAPETVKMRVDKLRDANKKTSRAKLEQRAYDELRTEKSKNAKKEGKKGKNDKRGDGKPAAGNGPRGAAQQ